MGDRLLSGSTAGLGARAVPKPLWSPGAVLLSLAIPVLFLHVRYQPGVTVHAGSTGVSIELSDLAVLAVAAAAVVYALRDGVARLRPGLPIWIAAAVLLAMVFASTLYGLASDDRYPFLKHLVTAGKFAEYAALAPAVPLLLRRRDDVARLLLAVAAWSAAATVFALLQFSGAIATYDSTPAGRRKPSFVGYHDFAALSGAVLAVGFVALALGAPERRERLVAGIAGASGAIGLVLAAALDAVAGVVLAALAIGLVARSRGTLTVRRAAAIVAVTGAVIAGAMLMRSSVIDQYLRFLGVRPKQAATTENIQSYAQRTLLAYIGVRIFADHPAIGVGWQGSGDEENFAPYLADARAKFDQPPRAFPSPQHPWGVQNAFVQALADLGILGFGLLVGLFGAGIVVAARAALRAPPAGAWLACIGLLWLLVAIGVWNGVGLVAGIPLDALTWLGLGFAGAAATATQATCARA